MACPAVASSSGPWSFDVFLSFRGEDTRNNFIAHLFKALDQKGIYTYMDDKLEGGEEISPALLKAIKESRIAIIVLSENYASSTWCLDELKEIFECREKNQQTVLPVFYKVLPSDVRYQKKKFGEALAKHTGRFKKEIVQRWKEDLQKVSELSGYHLTNGNESKFINEIVQVVSTMVSPTCLNVPANYPVGIESHVQDINVLLRIGMRDKRMVGIFGVGGIGKTTIAEAIYNSIAHQFEDKCFLENVRENSKREYGLLRLQEKLLSQILRDSNLKVHTVNLGKDVIKKRLCMKKVLLVLDDVDELIQLETLSGELDWFGLESRIIITTRDEHLLATHGVDLRYKMNELQDYEALKVFSRHAFHSDKPNDDFVELTKHALHYAGGNPLALRVVGSNLYGKGINHWKSELEKYKENPHTGIYDVLKISYDGLEENEKNIFLDIACFFKGEDAKYVTHILNSCSLFPDSGIGVLIDKSLITIKCGNLVMHDLLQDMGREIVRQESPNELGKRSRLWYHEDVRYVLEENVGTENIKGILVDLPERDLIQWRSNTFENMKRLRYFICRNAEFSKELTYLPNELRVLDWTECPLHSLPSNFHGRKLTILRMRNGLFKGLKEGFQNLPNLSIMELIGLENLTEIPNISRIPNLQKLRVFECNNLVKVDDSVGCLDKLTNLDFYVCSNLITLPRSLKLRSLETLRFQYCASLQNFPEIECKMECLEQFVLRGIAIKELPSSIVYFTGLAFLDIEDCKNLTHLPSSLQLQPLNIVGHERCSKFVKLPVKAVRDERESMLSVVSTKESEISSSTKLFASPPPANACIFDDGCSSIGFPALQILYLKKCTRLVKPEFFMTLNCFSSLDCLNLSGSDIVRLPACIKRFLRLRYLCVRDCKRLEEIPELPPSIEDIEADGCVSLESFPDLSKKLQFNTSGLRAVKWIGLSECYKLDVNIGNQVENTLLDKGPYNDYSGGGIVFPGNRIPEAWFSHHKENSYGGNSCAIDINGLPYLDEIKGIAFCAIFEPILGADLDEDYVDLSFAISSKGIEIETRPRFIKLPSVLCSNHVWLEYLVLEPVVLEEDNLQVRFVMSLELFIKSCRVHLIHKHEENAKDHPSLTHVDFNFCLQYSDGEIEYFHSLTREDECDEKGDNSKCSAEEDDCDEIERILDGIQPSKRQRDAEDDCNLESSYYSQQKKRSSTLGESQLNQSDHSQC